MLRGWNAGVFRANYSDEGDLQGFKYQTPDELIASLDYFVGMFQPLIIEEYLRRLSQ